MLEKLHSGLASVLVVGGAIASCVDCVIAQVVPDASLGTESSVVIPQAPSSNVDLIQGGATRGTNLFHSFEQFSVLTGREAFFNNATDIQNIISRVTGASSSNIDGLIRAGGTANLFLINPNGITFGPNATLSIGSSFLGSTASGLNFGDGSVFSATAPQTMPLLTVSVPIGLQFAGTGESIVNQARATNSSGQSVGLQVLPGKSLALVGGDVRLEGGRLQALGGRVELGGLAGAGTVGLSVDSNNLLLSFPDDVARADVYLTNNGSNRSTINIAASNGGSIGIAARNIDISGDSELRGGLERNSGFSGAQAGDIEINATGVMTIAGRESSLRNIVRSGAVGNGGSIDITTGSLSVTTGAELNASNLGRGNGGNVTIRARDTVSFIGDNSRPFNNSRAVTEVDPRGVGDGGNIDITTRSLSLTDGANLTATTIGRGNAGNINIKTGSLLVRNGAQLNASTQQGQGNGGDITIDATDTVVFDGVGRFEIAGRGAQAVSRLNQPPDQPTTVGNGGNINIKTGSLFVRNGAQLATFTEAQGNGGDITIDATDTVSFDGPSRAISNALERAVGNAGNINITTGSLSVTNGAQVTATNEASGAAGNIEVEASSIRLDTQGSIRATVRAGNQGNIRLNSQDLVLRNGSFITTNAQDTATGGNITIDTDNLVALENSDIRANAVESFGGRVIINAQGIFGPQFREQETLESDITAISAAGSQFNGIVELNTPEVDPSQGLVTLPSELVDVSNQIANSCAAGSESIAKNKFIITGRGGLPPSPNEPLIGETVLTEWAILDPSVENRSDAPYPNVTKGTAPTTIVEAQGWAIAPNGEVILTASATTIPNSSRLIPTSCNGS